MPERRPFQYTILRLVPRIERGECINVGVVLFCRQHGFLRARIGVDESRLRALAPGLDATEVRVHLGAIEAVVDGAEEAGALGRLDQSERFGWVAARSSTVIQASEVHTGLTDDPAATLEHLYRTLVQTD
ncbi:MAG TPA: DUF3037 domain-containing protein [Solirubrobacteraceae bacterium]|nr:DUF3037 domain-containing protein [Solirubrobacteraceae bacterium]